MKRFFYLSLVFFVTYTQSQARDLTHYPRGNIRFASNIKQTYRATLDDIFPLTLQVGLDSEFTPEQLELLDRSLQILIERVTAPHILDCAFREAYRGIPKSRDIFVKELYNAMRPIAIGEFFIPSFAFISTYKNDPQTVGLGYVGLFYDSDHPLPGHEYRHYLYIALNGDHMGGNSKYSYRSDAEYWAGVIAHEFLHNLGYDHPQSSSGYFIKEFGICVASNGTGASSIEGLEDMSIYKPLED